MRLLDVHQLKLKYFDETKRPPYAILSHTWGNDEVTLQDLETPAATSMAGYAKVKKCCELAIQDGFKYVWIDTCCIDKTSSSELSEAINSMHQWYKSSVVCYAYLSDVQAGGDPSDPESPFSKSRWFTRGWTLQELIAPIALVFYDCRWTEIGTKFSLQEDISRITGIPREALAFKSMSEFSIAQRMSWAAMRETTRVEDIAYCLMGIFDVNMPTLYGEGQQAFFRLQQEIMNSSDDHSLFVWATPNPTSDQFRSRWLTNTEGHTFPTSEFIEFFQYPETGLLASSPRQFQYAQGVRRLQVTSSKHPHSLTNNGLHIWLPVVRVPDPRGSLKIYQAILNCEILGGMGPLSIYLLRKESGQYCRILTSAVRTAHDVEYDPEPVELYVKDIRWSSKERKYPQSRFIFRLVDNPSFEEGYTLLECDPDEPWDQETRTLELVLDGTPRMRWSYFVVGLNTDPRVRALVILVNVHRFSVAIHKPKFYCVVCALSEINGTWNVRMGDGDHLESDFSAAASRLVREAADSRLLLEPDRVSKQLPSGHTISIAIHPGPQNAITDTVTDTGYSSWVIHEYRVAITFTTPNLLFRSPVIPRPVYPRPGAPLPELTIYVDVLLDRLLFVPHEQHRSPWVADGHGAMPKLIWTPTEQEKSAALAIFIQEKLVYPLLKFDVVDSDIVLELANDPPGLGQESGYGLSRVMGSYVDKTNPTDLGTRKRYRFPADFPAEVEMDGRTMRIELTNQRITLNDVASYQMLLRTHPMPPQQNPGPVKFSTAVNWSETRYSFY